MKCLVLPNRLNVMMAVVLTLIGLSPAAALAESPVKMKNFTGAIDLSSATPMPFVLEGTASHLGRFAARGEVELVPGEEEGTLVGDGVVVFETANGDLLVGVASWDVDQELGRGHITNVSWRDFVEFSDGSIVECTGRFAEAEDRPPGLVSIEYIVILSSIIVILIANVRR